MKDKNISKEKLIRRLKDIGIFEAVGDPIGVQDTDFKILFQNQRHRDLIGDRIGEYCYKAIHGIDHVCERCLLAKSFQDGKSHTFESSGITKKGLTYVEITTAPIRDSTGRIVAGIEMVRDMTERKLMEMALQKAKDELETRVKERTEELVKANEALHEGERKLRIYSKELEESNTALKVLLKQREQDQKEFENNILSNMKYLVFPYIEKLKKNKSMSEELVYLNIIESNIKEIISPFSSKLSFLYLNLTPREIMMANLIKDGKQDKDIMEILNISLETVKSHRQNIRKKLDIYGKRTNLRTKLLSLAK